MGLYNNVPTFTYISATGITVSYNDKVYTVQSFYTNKKYIYWDSDNGTVLQASNTMPTRSEKLHLVLINDNGIVTTVPSTSSNFEISYDGDSDDAIKSRIYALYEKDKELGDKYMAIEEDVDGIKKTIGSSDGKTGTIIDRVSKVEQYADRINLSVSDHKKTYDSDKEINELRDNVNAAIIKLNSDVGMANSNLQDYYKDNIISNEEKTSIQTIITQIESSKGEVLSYIAAIKNKSTSSNFSSLDNSVSQLNAAHKLLIDTINAAIGDSNITPSEKTVIINAFANYNLKINEFKNTCDDFILLGFGGVISEKLALVSMKSNEIKLSVSSTESNLSNKLNEQNKVLNKEISDTKSELLGEINDVLDSLGDLETNINEAFRDGVLSDAEKVSISQQLQRLEKEKEDVDKQYEALYNNSFLVDGTTYKPKSELKTAYTRFTSRYSSLVTAINTVVNKTTNITDADRLSMENSMIGYREASSNYMTKATNAMDSIADKRAENQSSKIDKKYSEIILSEDGIINQVSNLQGRLNNNEDDIEDLYEKSSKVEQSVDNLKISFKESGGYNRLYNGAFLTGDLTHWSNWGSCTKSVGSSTDSGLAKCLTITSTSTNQGVQQTVSGLVAGKKYTLSALVQAASGKCSIQVNNNGSYLSALTSSTGKYEKLFVTFTASTTQVTVQLGRNSSGSNGTYYYAGVLLTEGSIDIPWSPHPSEVYEGVTNIDRDGIKVSQSNYNGHTRMSASGFYVNNGSEDVISVTSSGATFKGKITVSSGSTIPTSTLSGTVSKNQLHTDITNSISNAQNTANNAQNAANNAQTYANNAKVAADNAQNTANTAKSDAATANSKLSDISNDNKLTPSEKQSTKKEWDKIVGEKSKIVADATTYGQNSATYTSRYDTLNTYITPLLSNLTTTSDIVGSTFRSHFTNYYNARQDLLNAISSAAKTLADNAQAAANNAQNTANNAQNTANNNKNTLDNNKDNWSNAFNRVKEWAYGAVSGTTTINGGLIQSNTVLAKHIAANQIVAEHISSKTLTGVTIKNDAGTFIVNPSGSITIGSSSSYRTYITNSGMSFNDSSGKTYSKLDGGRFYFTDNNGATVGFVGRNNWVADNSFLTSLTANYNHSVSISCQESSSIDYYYPSLVVSSNDMSLTSGSTTNYYKQGANIITPRITSANFIPLNKNWTGGYYPRVSGIETSNGRCLELIGTNEVALGVLNSSYSGYGLRIVGDSSAPNKTAIHFWGHINMHGHDITNGNIRSMLDAQSPTTYDLMKSGSLEMDIYNPYTFTENELRYVHRDSMHTIEEYDYNENGDYVPTGRYVCYCELPIFMAENMELDYHINIGKLSFGDYRIIEKNPYYFIVESEKDIFSFTYEVIGKRIDKYNNNAVVANYGLTAVEDIKEDVLKYKMD